MDERKCIEGKGIVEVAEEAALVEKDAVEEAAPVEEAAMDDVAADAAEEDIEQSEGWSDKEG